MNEVTPFLMFNDQLEAAMEFYANTFPDSEIENIARTGKDGPVTSAELRVGVRSSWATTGARTSRSPRASRSSTVLRSIVVEMNPTDEQLTRLETLLNAWSTSRGRSP